MTELADISAAPNNVGETSNGGPPVRLLVLLTAVAGVAAFGTLTFRRNNRA